MNWESKLINNLIYLAHNIGFDMSKKNQPSVVNSLYAKLSFKLIILGDSSVGKTSLVLKYVKDTFSKNSSATIGV
jgi:GTPase SAR1 family protein